MATATRARRGTKAVKPVEEDIVEDEDAGSIREPSEMHELMAEFFNDNYDANVTPRQCAIYTSKRGAFRRSDEYKEYRERAAAAADERATARQVKAAEPKAEPAEKPARARRGRPAAAKAEEPEETSEPKVKPTPPRRRRAAAAAVKDEAVTADTAPTPPARRRRSAAKPAASEEEPF